MHVSDFFQNPEAYVGKEVTVRGIVHRTRGYNWFVADEVLETEEIPEDATLVLDADNLVPQKTPDTDYQKAKNELIKLIRKHVDIGDVKATSETFKSQSNLRKRGGKPNWRYTTLHYGNLPKHLSELHPNGMRSIFESTDEESWKSIDDPFFDDDFESEALDWY